MDREAWWVTFHGVTKSQTRLGTLAHMSFPSWSQKDGSLLASLSLSLLIFKDIFLRMLNECRDVNQLRSFKLVLQMWNDWLKMRKAQYKERKSKGMNNNINLAIPSFTRYLPCSLSFLCWETEEQSRNGLPLQSLYLNGKDTFCNEQKLRLWCLTGKRSAIYSVNYYQDDKIELGSIGNISLRNWCLNKKKESISHLLVCVCVHANARWPSVSSRRGWGGRERSLQEVGQGEHRAQ